MITIPAFLALLLFIIFAFIIPAIPLIDHLSLLLLLLSRNQHFDRFAHLLQTLVRVCSKTDNKLLGWCFYQPQNKNMGKPAKTRKNTMWAGSHPRGLTPPHQYAKPQPNTHFTHTNAYYAHPHSQTQTNTHVGRITPPRLDTTTPSPATIKA